MPFSVALVYAPSRAYSTSLRVENYLGKASHLAAALQQIAKKKRMGVPYEPCLENSGGEPPFDIKLRSLSVPSQRSPLSSTRAVNTHGEQQNILPSSFRESLDAIPEKQDSSPLIESLRKGSHKLVALKAVLQAATDCGRAAYFKHMYRQKHWHSSSSHMQSTTSSEIDPYRKSSLEGSCDDFLLALPTLDEEEVVDCVSSKNKNSSVSLSLASSTYLSQMFPSTVQIHRRWKRLPAHQKLRWILHSPQGPHLCRILFNSPLFLRRNKFSLIGKQRRRFHRKGVGYNKKGNVLTAMGTDGTKKKMGPHPLPSAGTKGSSLSAVSVVKSSSNVGPAIWAPSTAKLPAGSKQSVALGVRALVGYEKNSIAVRHRPVPQAGRKQGIQNSLTALTESPSHKGSYPLATNDALSNPSSFYFSFSGVGGVDGGGPVRPCFLPLTVSEIPVTTQRVAEMAAAKRRRHQHLAWKRTAISLFRDQRRKGSASFFLKCFKAMQRRVRKAAILRNVVQGDKVRSEEEKIQEGWVKMKGQPIPPFVEKHNTAVNNAIAERDFQDYCTFFNVLQSPRKAYIMSKLEPLLDEIERSPNNQLEQVQQLTRKFSKEFDEEFKKQEKTAGNSEKLHGRNSDQEIIENEYFFAPEYLEKSQREKAKSRLQNFQDKLPYWKKLLISL